MQLGELRRHPRQLFGWRSLHGRIARRLANVITSNGGTVLPSTSTLSNAYLSKCDVFYTSLLNSNGTLSASEQNRLQTWIAGGGTLVVTGDIFPLPSYESFTSFYGVTNYTSISSVGTGSPVAAHPITAGVNTYSYSTKCTFTYGGTAQLLGDDGSGNDFMIVLEPGTGFVTGGRICVIGDHNMFADANIGNADNTLLATNIAKWACPVCPSDTATWSTYGAGWPGTHGVPGLVATGDPVVGCPVGLQVGNSLGAPTTAFMLLGLGSASSPTALGGTIVVSFIPAFAFPIPMPATGFTLAGSIPPDSVLCGIDLYLQFLEIDPGASHGASFTRGLNLHLGS